MLWLISCKTATARTWATSWPRAWRSKHVHFHIRESGLLSINVCRLCEDYSRSTNSVANSNGSCVEHDSAQLCNSCWQKTYHEPECFCSLLLYMQVVLSQYDTRRNTWSSFPCRQPLSETGHHLVWLHLCSGNVQTHSLTMVLWSARCWLTYLSAAQWGCVLSTLHSSGKPDAELSCCC